MAELIDTVPELSKDLAERLSGLAVNYALPGHPLAGSRAPDLPLAGSTATLFSALHEARPVIVAVPGFIDDALAAELRGRGLSAQPLGRQERAEWADVTVALVRPDGYVAWATEAGERAALSELRGAIALLRPGTG